MPVEVALGFFRVGVKFGKVAWATWGEGVGKRLARDFFEGVDHFEDGGGVASAEIVCVEAGF